MKLASFVTFELSGSYRKLVKMPRKSVFLFIGLSAVYIQQVRCFALHITDPGAVPNLVKYIGISGSSWTFY